MLKAFLTNRDTSRGITLVEMLMVMAIFSIVMMAVMSLFIPAVKSTSVQTQVTDVQSNLRLAMNRLTQDLLTAGFLTGTTDAIIFESGTEKDPVDFTIQTVAVGSGFGRVESASDPKLTLTQPSMVNSFPNGSTVRLFEPVSATELVPGVVHTVSNAGVLPGVLEISNFPGGGVPAETIIVRVRDAGQPVLQSIRYRLLDSDGDGTADALVRIVNGATQFLARNISSVNFAYSTPGGRINRVDITLAGQTDAVGTDAISSAKTKVLRTSVKIRNVF